MHSAPSTMLNAQVQFGIRRIRGTLRAERVPAAIISSMSDHPATEKRAPGIATNDTIIMTTTSHAAARLRSTNSAPAPAAATIAARGATLAANPSTMADAVMAAG